MDDNNRIDLGKELGGANDQLLRDIKNATKGELERRKSDTAKEARTKAIGQSTKKYIVVAVATAIILLIAAYLTVFRPSSKNSNAAVQPANGSRVGVRSRTLVAPSTTPSAPQTIPSPDLNEPQTETSPPDQPPSGDGYQQQPPQPM